jgi:hypothetical protein
MFSILIMAKPRSSPEHGACHERLFRKSAGK